MDWRDQLRVKYKTANVVEKLIALNIGVFVLQFLFQTLAFLFQFSGNFFVNWFSFPTQIESWLYKPWSVISYAFLHAGFFHLLFNMIVLHFAGRFFLTFFAPKKLLNYYFLGAISGALLFALSYNLFPVFSNLGNVPLIGASAAVMAILIGVATQAPQMQIRLLLIGNVKLWHIAVVFVVLDVIRIPFGNAGGHIAHLGGALLGYAYTKQLNKGNDIGLWFEKIFDAVAGWFSSASSSKKTPFKKVYRNPRNTYTAKAKQASKTDKQKKIDAILDKISENGYESLSKEEKDFLFKVGKE
ncbi:rhomboid family intramembrane serine protease [uncultured Mesonia sp.]|uniref:rhomboid family intramembrane serine protease n=1 Tax=uncultured Mesonia sp. TaxID=399731 RepID=UPI00374E570E